MRANLAAIEENSVAIDLCASPFPAPIVAHCHVADEPSEGRTQDALFEFVVDPASPLPTRRRS